MKDEIETRRENEDLPDDAIGRLIAQAGPAPTALPAAEEAIRQAVHHEWKVMIAQRRRARMRWISLAATLVIAIAALLGWQIISHSPRANPIEIATLLPSAPGVVVRRQDSPAVVTPHDEIALFGGDQLQTGAHGIRVTLKSGIALRIAPHSDLRLNDLKTVTLLAGAVYFEGASPEAPLAVNTTFGSVTHIGTRYLAQLTDSALIVSVREGEARITSGVQRLSVTAHEQLTIGADGRAMRSAISGSGEIWSWADALAPAMEIENQRLDEFLVRVSQETGRQLIFADASTRAEAHETVLHGSVANLSVEQALATVLMTTDFDQSIDADHLVIQRRKR